MSQLSLLRRLPLTSFFALAYAWTWLCWLLVYADLSGRLSLPLPKEWLATLGQFGPFLAAIVVTSSVTGRAGLAALLSRLVRWRVHPIWFGVSLALLPATMLLAIWLFSWLHGATAPLAFRESWSTLPAHFVYLLLLGGPLGEEPGWRGFALPRLQDRYGSVMASLWLGLLSAGWHLPLWWIYPPPCHYLLFVAGAVLLSFLFTWLFNHTRGSVLVSLLFHASLSIASVRLPQVPAYPVWLLLLLALVLAIVWCDRHWGQAPREGLAS